MCNISQVILFLAILRVHILLYFKSLTSLCVIPIVHFFLSQIFQDRRGDVTVSIKVFEGESLSREHWGTIAAAIASGVGIAVIDEIW